MFVRIDSIFKELDEFQLLSVSLDRHYPDGGDVLLLGRIPRPNYWPW